MQNLPQSFSDLIDGADMLSAAAQVNLAAVDLACLGGAVTLEDLHQYVATLEHQNQELSEARVLKEQCNLLAQVTACFQASFNEAEVFGTVLPALVQILGGDRGEISLYNGSGTLVLVRYEYDARSSEPQVRCVDFPSEAPGRWSEMQWSEMKQFCTLASESATNSTATLGRAVSEFTDNPQVSVSKPSVTEPAYLDHHQDVVCLVSPIADFQGCLGELRLVRQRSNGFTPSEQQLISQVIGQCSLGLRRNRLAQANTTQAVELKHLNQLQDTFLGTVSYELRIPLANMRMAVQMMNLALKRPEDSTVLLSEQALRKIQRYLEVLERECDRETKLIQDLLDLQQVDADLLSLVIAAIDLEEWLPYVLKGFAKRSQEWNLTLDWSIDPALPALMSDQITLSRIVTELVGNAHKFTPSGGHIQVDLFQQTINDGAQLVIAVTNTGVEIPIEDQGRVFDKFYRIAQLDIRRLGGIGLGLSLAEQLTQRLGGQLRLVSQPQKTCFRIELPFVTRA